MTHPIYAGFRRFRQGARERDQAAREAPSRLELAEAIRERRQR